jgi:hypothetical protein
MKLNDCFKIKSEIAWRKAEDETVVIVSPITETIYTLNKTAGMVWEILETQKTVENVVQYIYNLFKDNNKVDLNEIKDDVFEIIEDFDQRKLLDKIDNQ